MPLPRSSCSVGLSPPSSSTVPGLAPLLPALLRSSHPSSSHVRHLLHTEPSTLVIHVFLGSLPQFTQRALRPEVLGSCCWLGPVLVAFDVSAVLPWLSRWIMLVVSCWPPFLCAPLCAHYDCSFIDTCTSLRPVPFPDLSLSAWDVKRSRGKPSPLRLPGSATLVTFVGSKAELEEDEDFCPVVFSTWDPSLEK